MIYEQVIRLCAERKISVAKLERETGLGNGTIGRWVKSSPSVENAKKVAKFFGVTLDELIKEGEQCRD